MLNVKLIKVEDYNHNEYYINLNYVISISEEIGNTTLINFVDKSKIIVDTPFNDFIDYLVELSGIYKGGESE